MQRFEASVSEPTIEGGGYSANSVLEKSEAGFDVLRVEGCNAHEDILEDFLANRSYAREE